MPNQGLLDMITVVATMTREAAGVGQQRMARTALPKTQSNPMSNLSADRPDRLSDQALAPVDKRFNPKPRGGDIEEAHEGQGGFVVSGCNTPHLLEFVEHPLNAIAVSVTPPVCFLWNTAAFS